MNRYHGSPPSTTSYTVSIVSQAERLLSCLTRRVKGRYVRTCSILAYAQESPREAQLSLRAFVYRHATSPLNLLILLWMFLLCWGEAWVFDNSIKRCDWGKWEKWPSNANPHHIAFVSDPQLVDPHTYPGRPWPLSALTFKHTDLYMRRAYSRIQQELDPNTIIFLGDLFDGGREWATSKSFSPERRFRKYDEEYWLNEYERFSAIFLREWKGGAQSGRDRRDGRRIIATLPGNHDLGFARGIQKPVRDRFMAIFGDGNRLDIIGNHTFVHLDTPSLSASEQVAAEHYEHIWRPPYDFLKAFETNRASVVGRHLRHLQDAPHINALNEHEVLDIDDPKIVEKVTPSESSSADGLPTVLLTHIPFYRMQGEPCGPFREHDPPIPRPPERKEPWSPDDGNAIPLGGGYQYQTVVSGQLTSIIAQDLGGSIEYIFSGDDHDYCDVIHRSYPSPKGQIREVTVKSISEAMGVRKPGFVLASLWNPIDSEGHRIKSSASNADEKTLESHLCLLPDVLSIVIKYAIFLVVSLIFLFLYAINSTIKRTFASSRSVTPTSPDGLLSAISTAFYANFSPPPSPTSSSAEREKSFMNDASTHHRSSNTKSATFSSSSTSSSEDSSAHLSARSGHVRSSSPLPSYIQDIDAPSYTHTWAARRRGSGDDEASFAYSRDSSSARIGSWSWLRNPLVAVLVEWVRGIWYVARIVVAWYLVLFNYW